MASRFSVANHPVYAYKPGEEYPRHPSPIHHPIPTYLDTVNTEPPIVEKKKKKKLKSLAVPILIAVVFLLILGISLYFILSQLHLNNEDDNNNHLHEEPLRVGPHQQHVAPLTWKSGSISESSISYSFTLGSELLVEERHPKQGTLLDIPPENLRYYTVCCSIQGKSFVCRGGVSYAQPGVFFEALLRSDERTGDLYLSIWISGRELLGSSCYAHISYLPP